jgi:hypothetical protein
MAFAIRRLEKQSANMDTQDRTKGYSDFARCEPDKYHAYNACNVPISLCSCAWKQVVRSWGFAQMIGRASHRTILALKTRCLGVPCLVS